MRAQLSTTYLRAPFAGIIAEVTGEVGEFTTPSPPGIPTPPAVDLIDDTCLYVTAPMDEIDAPKIIVGQPGRISIDAYILCSINKRMGNPQTPVMRLTYFSNYKCHEQEYE